MRKIATTVYLRLLGLGGVIMALATGAARADPSIVSLSSTEGVLGSFVILYGSGFGDAQGQSYVLYGVASFRRWPGPMWRPRWC